MQAPQQHYILTQEVRGEHEEGPSSNPNSAKEAVEVLVFGHFGGDECGGGGGRSSCRLQMAQKLMMGAVKRVILRESVGSK